MSRLVPLAVVSLILASACSASAAPILYAARLDGPSEIPVNASPGVGSALVTVDPVAHTLRLQVSFSGLLGNTTVAHIHSATPVPFSGVSGVATTTPTFPGFPVGVTSGTYDQTFNLTLASSYNPAFVTANGGTTASAEAALLNGIANGRAYLNIHSTSFPGGEIRGFLVATPEPATLAVFGGVALAGALGYRRRRATA